MASSPAAQILHSSDVSSNSSSSYTFKFDPNFEFSAPQFYDFTVPETLSQVLEAERWFQTSGSHSASPFSIRSRGIKITPGGNDGNHTDDDDEMDTSTSPRDCAQCLFQDRVFSSNDGVEAAYYQSDIATIPLMSVLDDLVDVDLQTPVKQCDDKGLSACRVPVSYSPASLSGKRIHADISKKIPHTEKAAPSSTTHLMWKPQTEKPVRHGVQAVKKQKLEGGRLRQIMNVKDEKQTTRAPANSTVPRGFNFSTERRLAKSAGVSSVSKVSRPRSPFVSMAEKVQRFQMRTRDCFQNLNISHDDGSCLTHDKPLKLTKPKEPDFETSQRARPARMKSAAELEAEMLAKMPKFKARPLNKKILEAPALPALPKTKPTLPEFQVFHLRTTERALQHCGAASIAPEPSGPTTIDDVRQNRKSVHDGRPAEPREPHLATAARARPIKVKSSEDREQEELSKIPKFKARPFDKKIFFSRGDMGIFKNTKRQVTMPVEFHFATDERTENQAELPLDLFNKLSINPQKENHPPRPTIPEPFHLLTEDRGHQKQDRLLTEIKENELREREQRIPKANPLPCTTDYPEIPPKPEPKDCTRPQPFCLESIIRHQEELARVAEEKRRLEKEEAERRQFYAKPVSCLCPVFVPERSRKPLTEVLEFGFKVDARAVERADFDKKVAEKQNSYKRFREECEAARKAEEDRLIKYMRRTMVPHARPVPTFDKPFVPKRCPKEPTRPCSPKLHVSQRKERRNSLTFLRESMKFSIQKRVQMR